MSLRRLLPILLVGFQILAALCVRAQNLPYVFQNSSRYTDSEIYVGLVGQFPGMGGVWMSMANSQLRRISKSENTLPGPAWAIAPEGGRNFANMFTRLSDIPNKTIQIPQGLFGCRILIAFQSPLYIYFFDTGGYAGADLQNPNDPSDGTRWELVELTWGDAGLWTNTSRVDSYQYPMGLEVTGYTGGISGSYSQSYYARVSAGGPFSVNAKIGELLSHETILNSWNSSVPAAYHGCKVIKTHSRDGGPILEQPSKISAFKPGGASANYFDSYINQIWSTYQNKDLLLYIGDRGTWRGRVSGASMIFTAPNGATARISNKPSTTEIIEGSGVLNQGSDDDKMIQAQFCAAINRHAIDTNTPDGVTQNNHDASRYFQIEPYNHYVRFFHNRALSIDSKTYAFSYDDVGDHSSTIQCTFPTQVRVVIGGYGSSVTELTANAGSDQNLSVAPGAVASGSLQGSAIDPKGGVISYRWDLVSGTATIVSPNSASTNVTGMPVGSHTFRLTATASGATATANVSINVAVAEVDLALNKPVTTSSTEGATYQGSNAVDGSDSTRWSSLFSDPQWIYVDLGAKSNITRVRVLWEAAMARDYLVQTTDTPAVDGSWQTIKTVQGNSTADNNHTGLTGTGRYLRIYGTARTTQYGYSIFTLQVFGSQVLVNTPPTIVGPTDPIVIVSNTSSPPIPVTVGDAETPAAALVLSAVSDNTTVVPQSGIALAGSGASRTMTITPAPNQIGLAHITLTVTDAGGLQSTQVFTVNVVAAPNTSPTISAISDQSILVGTSVPLLSFSVADAETPVANLGVSATADNPSLLPASGIILGGAGANRTLNLVPVPGQTGTATVNVQVTDAAGATATTTFTLTVRPINSAVMIDRNGNGISDVWELLYPNVGGPGDSYLGDGMTNLQKAMAGLNPTNPASRFRAATYFDPSGNLSIKWAGVGGKHYLIEKSTDLVNWTVLPTDYAGANADISALVRAAGSAADSRSFWRVSVYDVDSVGTGIMNDWERTHSYLIASIKATAGTNGSISPANTSYLALGSTITFTITPAANYIVDQVLVDGVSVGAVTKYNFVTSSAGAHTITASFKTNGPSNSTVTFDSQGATTPAVPTSQTVAQGSTVGTLPTPPAKTGFTFSGWYSATNGGGTVFTAGTPVSANTTVYAYWQPVAAVDFGSNVVVFDPGMSSSSIQAQIDNAYVTNNLRTDHFSSRRVAFMFKPGTYNVAMNVGYYTQALGLGQNPDAVQINGSIQADGSHNPDGNCLNTFWRGAENMAVTPSGAQNIWAVSQAAPMRRIHVKGNQWLFVLNPQNWESGYASGGFMGDCKVDGEVNSGGQQQFLFRNTSLGSYVSGVWNMVFVGSTGSGITPAFGSGTRNITNIAQTPVIREKPILYFDGSYRVFVPKLRTTTSGVSWTSSSTFSQADGRILDVASEFFVAKPTDSVAAINNALAMGKHLLMTPGIYNLTDSIQVTRPNTVVLGLGLATLYNNGGKPAMTVADVDGVTIAGLMFDAGSTAAANQIVVGNATGASHAANPTLLADLYLRIGGTGHNVDIDTAMVINSNDVIGDHLWIWRADHDAFRTYGAADWPNIKARTGLKVNGNRVTIYGLAVEHFQQYQTIWSGESGQVYFYQSEIPYDVPNMATWNSDGAHPNGWASYKVLANTHTAWGVGVYAYFLANPSCALGSAIEVPAGKDTNGQMFNNMMDLALGASGVGQINHLINQRGNATNSVSSAVYLSQ